MSLLQYETNNKMKKTPNILAHHQQVPYEMTPEETVQIIWLVCFNLLEKTAHITY